MLYVLMLKKVFWIFLWWWIIYVLFFSITQAVTIGIHGLQFQDDIKNLTRWEKKQEGKQVQIIWLIFDHYTDAESVYLHKVVEQLGTERIYHISLSPYGYTSTQVANGAFDVEYDRFFKEVKELNIKVVFRTMHEMNGWRYSRASKPEEFQKARKYVHTMARKDFDLQSDKLLFSLSFNSQDLPTTEALPTQQSFYEYCSQRRIDTKWRCPRMEDYYPWNSYVDLVWVTLYNRWRSRADSWSVWKDPEYLLTENNLIGRLSQRNKPIIIDELGTTAVNFDGEWTQDKVMESFHNNQEAKNTWFRQWKLLFANYPKIVGIVYFNVDLTKWATTQVLGQADWSAIMSPYISDSRVGKQFILRYGDDALRKLFVIKKKPVRKV